jgi:glycosyl hydrolase family 85
MTVDSANPDRMKWLGSNLVLGFLVTALSVFTAVTNYGTYRVGGNASSYQTEGDRLLANSNTEYIQATQYIIVDYTMYDGYYINRDKDINAADYYQSNFSDELKASVDRNVPFDKAYYDAMYKDSDTKFNDAFAKFELSDAEGNREAGYQLAMLVAAVGLAFAAYASLLEETNRLRRVFALMSLIMLVLSIGQFVMVSVA